jgi:hypothetical protein
MVSTVELLQLDHHACWRLSPLAYVCLIADLLCIRRAPSPTKLVTSLKRYCSYPCLPVACLVLPVSNLLP